MTAKRAPPLPGDHNQLYQVATSQSHSASVRRAYPRRAIVRPPAVDELRRIHLLRTPVHKGKKRRGPGLITSRPSPLLASVVGVHSFLAPSAASLRLPRGCPLPPLRSLWPRLPYR